MLNSLLYHLCNVELITLSSEVIRTKSILTQAHKILVPARALICFSTFIFFDLDSCVALIFVQLTLKLLIGDDD